MDSKSIFLIGLSSSPRTESLLVHHRRELLLHLLLQLLILLAHLLLTIFGNFELHAAQASLDVCRRIPNLSPRLTGSDGFLRLVVEAHHAAHHPRSLPQRTVLVVVTVSVLLQEVFLEEGSDIKGDLVSIAERGLANELHNLIEIFRGGKDLLDASSHAGELGHLTLVERLERRRVFGITLTRVNTGKMLSLRQLLVQTPEHLYDTKRGTRNRVREVTTRRRDSADDGDGALP